MHKTHNDLFVKQETIDINSLTIGYKTKSGTKIVAGNITTKLFSGELTCLLGANGVGKSTLLKTLSSFIPKIGGRISILGKEIEAYTEQSIATKIGVVLTEKCEVHNMSVRELVSMGRTPYTGFWGNLGKEDEEIINRSIKDVKIEHLSEKNVDSLSDGERQKAMLAKSLAQDTPVIFLDEPTAFLDYSSKVEIMQLLLCLSREKSKTIFISTHDMELALQIADKIWLMDKKHGIITGTPEDLSLNGHFNRFLSKKEIKFDMETGLYRLSTIFHSKIKLVGEGQKLLMIKKALQRNGVEASDEIESNILIEAGDMFGNGIIVHAGENETFKVESIEALLDLVLKN